MGSGVTEMVGNWTAFAALKEGGRVVTWGRSDGGGDASSVSQQLLFDVVSLQCTESAFAALKEAGAVVAWGNQSRGGDVDAELATKLSTGVRSVHSTGGAFAAL